MTAGLGLSTTKDASQLFGGAFEAEPEGWFLNGPDGRPLKASGKPIKGWIWHHDFHKGIDQYGALGTDLFALEAGKVLSINRTIGEIVVGIRGQANSRYSLNHCVKELVAVGAIVSKGQHIAEMGDFGNAKGVHVHTMVEFREKVWEKGSDGIYRLVTRWIAYDPALFMPHGSLKMGPYTSVGIKPGGIVPCGRLLYDGRIYPIRKITINDGTNVRVKPDTTSAPLLLTTAVTPASELNEVPGGPYKLSGVPGEMWAEVKLADARVGYVAKPLIKV